MLEAVLGVAGIEAVPTTRDFHTLLHPDMWADYDGAVVDLLLSDPEVNGGDIIRWLHDNVPHVRRVVLSAVADLEHVVGSDLRQLAHAVLVKPCRHVEIIAALGGTDGG